MTTHTVKLIGPTQRAYAARMIADMPVGAVVTFKPEPTRSTEQNAKMWAMLKDVNNSGLITQTDDPDMLKALFMKACGHEVAFIHGLDGEPFPVGFRSSKLSVSKMADLITFIQWWGDEHDVKWTEKEKNGWAE